MKFIRHLPLIGAATGVCLLIVAAGRYPGGTLTSANTVGYSWTRNFLSSLFGPTALNGAPNPAQWVARVAMVFLCVSLGAAYFLISRTAGSRVHRKTIEIGGIGTAVYALVIATPLHNVGVSVGLVFSFAALFATTHMLYLERRWLHFVWAAINITFSFVSAWMYYGNMLYGALPIIQKVSLASYIGWLLSVYYARFGSTPQISAAKHAYTSVAVVALLAFTPGAAFSQAAPKTIVAVLAHPDDETNAGPVLARYAREGVQVYLLIATDGSQGTGSAAARGETVQAGQGLARERAEEARCSAQALGAKPPILLSFPDGRLGDYIDDRTLMTRLTQALASELQRLHPDVIVTWGPEGGTGHPDHRIVGDIVMQLARAGAPGVPERIFYMHLPAEAIRAMNPQRGAPPLLEPAAKYVTAHVSFTSADFDAAMRSMACHTSQFSAEVVQRMSPVMKQSWNGTIAFVPGFPTAPVSDLFR